jgi:putative spermidine/putrescine transport system substrate-binding protein
MKLKMLGGVLVLAALVGFGSCRQPTSAGRELVVVSYGGAYQDAQRKAIFEPFEKATGIKIKEAEWSGDYAKLKAMVDSGTVSWDLVVSAESSDIERGIKDGILERIDYTGIDRSRFYPDAFSDYSVGLDYFATVMGYSKKIYADGTPRPQTWADFWDTKKFPGKRSLRKDPRTTLEFALLADGVPMDKLYPLDVERALRSLDKIAPNVSVWWTSGHQPAQLLADNEVVLVSAFNGRIWAAAVHDGVPVDVEWNQGALDKDSWIIPKGTPKLKEAMELIRYTCQPQVQIELTKYINYGPTMPEAYQTLDAKARAVLPTSPENRPKQFIYNAKWWAENEAAVIERWNKWLLKR